MLNEPKVQPSNSKERYKVNFEGLNSAPSKSVGPEVNKISLIKELKHGNPSSFIISGYRGAGKTSYINYVEDLIDIENKNKKKSEEHILFIKCNFSKEESKTNILRKLIRNLWVKTQEEKDIRKKIKNPIKKEFDLLYKRTFYNVDEINRSSTETIRSSELKLNSLVIFAFILIAVIPLIYNINSEEIIKMVKDAFSTKGWLIGFSSIFSIGGFLLYVWLRKVIIKKTREVECKTLYDDEIAELKLFEVINKLEKVKIKTIFVIDELDKVDNDEDLERLISELKPLILSGTATFILVTGQKLYYQLEKSKYLDDAILPNLFINPYHIPLLDIESFRKLYEEIVLYDNAKDKEAYDEYFSTIILRSNRSPRKFLNLIRNDLIWEGNEAYIEIENTNNNTKMLKSLTILVQEENLDRYEKAQQDFLITQLHISLNKVLNLGLGYFDSSDIFSIDGGVNEKYPEGYWERAEKLVGLLLQKLVKDNLLELNTDTEKYTLTDHDNQSTTKDIDTLIGQFIRDYNSFEVFMDGIFKEVVGVENTEKRIPLFWKIKELSKRKVITNYEKIKNVQEIRNKVVHNSLNINDQINEIREAQHNVNMLRPEILEHFTYSVINNVFAPKGFHVEIPNSVRDLGYDISAYDQKVRFIFEVRVMSKLSSSIERNLMQFNSNIERINAEDEKDIFGILVIYCSDIQMQFDLDSLLQQRFDSDNLITIYPNVNRTEDTQFLSDYMEEVLNKTIDGLKESDQEVVKV
ncbi:P-loop NTPase fold protein [Virgibacillus halodenitrificans]|uniref:P-loop NTPase fold protein n=1 Tax=Virgibacillus halodenitrificans TaxID=1482 RepID=UPI001F2688DE|nr:P-loop NTPase fold protein [Virgibacillus halodenitrificans]